MKKICILSFECPPAKFSDLSFPNKQKYCDYHGYDFLSFSNTLSSRPPSWDKILYIEKVFEENDYDWIFWQDSDSYVINHLRKVEEFLDESKDLVVCEDDVGINLGLFLIKRSDFSFWFLKEVWNYQKYGNTLSGTVCNYIAKEKRRCKYDAWEQTNAHSIIGLHGEKFTKNIKLYKEHEDHFNVTPNLFSEKTFIIHQRNGYRNMNKFKKYIY
tara:strand:+ start:2231 stop:2872 length:642 start_codon:yes stop_codon:yes gene_type:complete